MKKICCFFLFYVSVATAIAQKETFDIVTYTPPKGWQKEVNGSAIVYTFIDKKDKSWCRVAIYKSTASKGNIENDFDSEWDILVAKQYQTTEPPSGTDTSEAEGWKIKSGAGKFIFNAKESLVLLTNFSGFGVCISIVAITPGQRYLKDIEGLIGSLELKKPETTNASLEMQGVNNENAGVPNNNQRNNSFIIGSWGKSNGVSQLYNRFGSYSYNKQQYTFDANGSYIFLSKNYGDDYAETILIKETGSYTINGDLLTIVPKTSVIESWSKKKGSDNWGQLKSNQKRPLEIATYQVKTEGKNLILSTSKETTRDGRFNNGSYYSYGTPETFTAIKLPGQ